MTDHPEGEDEFLVLSEWDITPIKYQREAHVERAKAQDLIRNLSLAVDQSPASVIITDTSATIEYVNRRFEEVTGYSAEEALGRNPRMLKSGTVSRETYRDLWRTIRDGRVWKGEIRNRRKNGELYWDSVSISPLRDAVGTVSHFLAIQEDITERKQAEQSIRDREERFRQLADNIKEVFFVMDAQYRETLYISPAYETIWGRSCRSLYENPQAFLEPVAPEDQARLFASIARIQQGEDPGEIEYRVVRPDGEVRWVLGHAVPIRDEHGGVYRISGVALDITERRRAEEALRESEERFRKLAEASFDAIAVSADGLVREANRGFLEMFGYSLEEVIQRPVTDFVAEESREDLRSRVANGVEGTYELVGRRKDGHSLRLEATTRIHTVDGRPARITALRDMTEKRALEEQFQQAQKMEAVGRLAGGVAHDFNNLLTVIMSYSDLLLQDFGTNDPRRDDLEQVQKAAAAAAALTRQLLAFSRQQVIEPRLLALEDVVAGAAKMLTRVIGEDIELVTVLRKEPSTVRIDPGQLEQVIMNLAVNARDAMPTGGRLTIETTQVDLDDTYARMHWPATPGQFAMLAVSDNGVGMDEPTRARIFEPFFTTKEPGKGTGLGLATVYGIVQQSGGFIWVYSEPGSGATFKIYLPLVDQEAGLNEYPATARAGLRGMETVLLAEDASAVRAVVRQTLERHGYTVLEAPNGKAALDLAAKQADRIDLLLTDVVMPEMSGRRLAERFTALRPGVKVLYMSGYTDDAVLRHGVLGPGVAYLQKPFSPDVLAGKVREVLDAP